MYGRALSCDECDKVEMLPIHKDIDSVEGAPEGWIRLSINRPSKYSWDKTEYMSLMVGSFDCCSISCAESVLNKARSIVPAVSE